jgi:two-component system nitrogen regulation response regulator GlnG
MPRLEFIDAAGSCDQTVDSIHADIQAAAHSDARVVIAGGTGADREALAHIIHRRSTRRLAPLTILSATGTDENTLATRMFHAFSRPNGTVFLDNVDELTPQLQELLYTFIEAGVVGSGQVLDVRVITGTQSNLLQRVLSGAFRDDLYYRLNTLLVALPLLGQVTRVVCMGVSLVFCS